MRKPSEKNYRLTVALTSLSLFTIVVAFQNCAPIRFGSVTDPIEQHCVDYGQETLECQSRMGIDSDSEQNPDQVTPTVSLQGGQYQYTTPTTNVSPSSPAPSSNTIVTYSTGTISPSMPVSYPPLIMGTQTYNFIGGSRSACESSIMTRLGVAGYCYVGGGCGLNCGVPNGTSCVSANPSMYGACIQASFGQNLVNALSSQNYSFIGTDKLSCETNLTMRLGIVASCNIGGACGNNCGAPSATCPSIAQNDWGACVVAFLKNYASTPDISVTQLTPPPPNSGNTNGAGATTYNFVASSKTQCEASIINKLGIPGSCTIGGGCGVSCGVPNSTSCASANPTLWGACIIVY